MEEYIPVLLTRLKEKYKLGLVFNYAYTHGFWKTLQRFNLTRLFDAVVVSGELGLRKPHPKIFESTVKTLDVDAVEAVFVGDSLKADVYGEKRIGFKMVLVENVGLRKNSYAIAGKFNPFLVKPGIAIPNLMDLPKILEIL